MTPKQRLKHLSKKYYFDKEAAQEKVDFIEQYCTHVKGALAGEPLILEDWIKDEIIYPVFGLMDRKGGNRLIYSVYIEIPKKNAKALDINTLIPTPDGWSAMLDINVGDYVFGDDGIPVKVIITSAIKKEYCYEIEFSGGQKIIASYDHLWEVYNHDWVKPKIMTTAQLSWRYTRNHIPLYRVKTCKSLKYNQRRLKTHIIEYSPRKLLIEPYTLGCWLGDGESMGTRITCEDDGIIENIKNDGYEIKQDKTKEGKARQFKIGRWNEIRSQLKKYNLLGNKHIPDDYLQSSVEQRYELLKGLMDTDGYISKKGQCKYTSIGQRLISEVYDLILSLGYRATKNRMISDYEGREYISYDVQFWADKSVPIFKLKRKKERQISLHKDRQKYRSIIKIKNIGKRSVKCIGVDNESKLYLATRSCIPTHNTTICAAIELALLFNDGEKGAEIYNCAGDAEQASLLFNIAKMMIKGNEDLKAISERFQTSITYKDSFIKKLTSAPETKHGFNASAVIYDELHVAKTRELYDSLYSAGAQRQNPLFIIITTAGNNKQSICYEQHQLTQKVLKGTLEDDSHWGVIYSADKKADIFDENVWRMANPLYDYSEPLRKFIKKMSIKVKNTPSFESTFRQLHLNQWVSAYDSWISDDAWVKCSGKEIDLSGMKCYGGLDLAATMDFNSLALLFPVEDMYYVKMFFWLPSDMVDKRVERYSVDFQKWVEKGYVKMTQGNVADYDIIKSDIQDLVLKYDIQSIGYDSKFAAPIVSTIEDVVMNPFSQSIMSMSFPTKMLEMNIMSKKINHFGNPILRWMCSNVAIYTDANENIKLVKNKSIDKIDGIVALVMALGESVQEGEQKSVYETRGIISIDDFDTI